MLRPRSPLPATMSTSSLRRQMKNIVHNYSEAEIKVREATSNDPWGPSSSLMSEIADLTYNVVAFSEIMSMIWKRLNDHGKNWRHVYKVSGCRRRSVDALGVRLGARELLGPMAAVSGGT